MCKASDAKFTRLSAGDVENRFLKRGTGGLGDYFNVASNGQVDFGTTTILGGWYTLPQTAKYYQTLAAGNPEFNGVYDDCVATATRGGYHFVPDTPTFVVTSPEILSQGSWHKAIVGDADPLDDWAHEFGHSLGWEHPFSVDTHFLTPPDPPGDYDDQYNPMSALADDVSTAMTGSFGRGPPLPDAYQMDQLGWLPRSRIVTFGKDGVHEADVTIVALGHPEIPGPFLLRVPVSSDPFSYYTVEMVAKDGWNSGVDQPRVLIKRVQSITGSQNRPEYYTFLYRQQDLSGNGNGAPFTNLGREGNGVYLSIALTKITAHHATLHVIAKAPDAATDVFGPNDCAPGYMWRQADDFDYVCVTPDVLKRTLAENAHPNQFRTGGTCSAGYLPRQAFLTDDICVPLAEFTSTQADNRAAASHLRNPFAAGAYGAN